MLLKITEKALFQFKNINKNHSTKYILFGIKSGGCNGFDYFLKPTNMSPEKHDELFTKDDVNIILCNKSLLYILGTEIDYTNNILGNSFKFKNPNAKSTCGCGTSFSP